MSSISLSGLSPSELNSAIDNTNFPRNNITENGSSSKTTPLSVINKKENENGETKKNGEILSVVSVGTTNNKLNRDQRPIPINVNNNYDADSSVLDVPGTPRTPRTSTSTGTLNSDRFLNSEFENFVYTTQDNAIPLLPSHFYFFLHI